MIIDILIILVLLFLINRKEHFAIDLVVNPYQRGITQDIQKIQMESVFDSLKGQFIDLDNNFEPISEDKKQRFVELSNELKNLNKKEANPNYSTRLITKLLKLITNKTDVFVDKNLDFLKNQKSVNFLSENSEFLPIQNSNEYRYIDSKLIEKKHLENNNAENYKLVLKFIRPMCVNYFKAELDFDLFDNSVLKVNSFKIEKKDNYTLSQRVAFNQNDKSCVDCKYKKPRTQAGVFEKNQEYRQIKELDLNNYRCTTKDTNDPIECASAEVENNQIVDSGDLFRFKCVSDFQCPMWQSNKNYPNSRGGCINEQCEFPIGMVPNSSVTFDYDSKPICHSRTGKMEECHDQVNDPSLGSPDYAFENDFNERLIYKNKLSKRGLEVQNLFPQF